eukprot:scaffold431_cov334-Pavlova_lutheri.AAC.90
MSTSHDLHMISHGEELLDLGGCKGQWLFEVLVHRHDFHLAILRATEHFALEVFQVAFSHDHHISFGEIGQLALPLFRQGCCQRGKLELLQFFQGRHDTIHLEAPQGYLLVHEPIPEPLTTEHLERFSRVGISHGSIQRQPMRARLGRAEHARWRADGCLSFLSPPFDFGRQEGKVDPGNDFDGGYVVLFSHIHHLDQVALVGPALDACPGSGGKLLFHPASSGEHIHHLAQGHQFDFLVDDAQSRDGFLDLVFSHRFHVDVSFEFVLADGRAYGQWFPFVGECDMFLHDADGCFSLVSRFAPHHPQLGILHGGQQSLLFHFVLICFFQFEFFVPLVPFPVPFFDEPFQLFVGLFFLPGSAFHPGVHLSDLPFVGQVSFVVHQFAFFVPSFVFVLVLVVAHVGDVVDETAPLVPLRLLAFATRAFLLLLLFLTRLPQFRASCVSGWRFQSDGWAPTRATSKPYAAFASPGKASARFPGVRPLLDGPGKPLKRSHGVANALAMRLTSSSSSVAAWASSSSTLGSSSSLASSTSSTKACFLLVLCDLSSDPEAIASLGTSAMDEEARARRATSSAIAVAGRKDSCEGPARFTTVWIPFRSRNGRGTGSSTVADPHPIEPPIEPRDSRTRRWE